MSRKNKKNLSDREFFESIVNMQREHTYTYILDLIGECDKCIDAREKIKKELIKIHKENISTMKKQINGEA